MPRTNSKRTSKPKKPPMTADHFFEKILPKILKDDYKERYAKLTQSFQEIPCSVDLSEMDNILIDQLRVSYILQAVTFLADYFTINKTPLTITEFPRHVSKINQQLQTEWIDTWKLLISRQMLEKIAFTIFNLSPATKTKYQDLLAPHGMSWDIFEHFGDLMKTKQGNQLVPKIRTVTQNTARRLIGEHNAIETTVEASLATIINTDLQSLSLLFQYIQRNLTGTLTSKGKFPAMKFTAILALTQRTQDTLSLVELAKYSSNRIEQLNDNTIDDQVAVATSSKKSSHVIELTKLNAKVSRKITHNSKLSRHAALRRCVLIAKFSEDRYLSAFVKNLDPTIDWQAYVTIAHTIANPCVGNNFRIIQKLLSDDALFDRIFFVEMAILSEKIGELINKRDALLSQFNHKAHVPDEFWSAVYKDIKICSTQSATEADLIVFNNFAYTRSYATQLSARFTSSFLCPKRHFDAAIEALENIAQFIKQDPKLKPNLDFETLDDWGKPENEKLVLLFYSHLIANPEFNDALAYNVTQLLQHLESLSDLPLIKGHRFIDRNIDFQTINVLKNWIAHDNHFHDKSANNSINEALHGTQGREKIIGAVMVTLIYILLPDLIQLRDDYLLELSKDNSLLRQSFCAMPTNPSTWDSFEYHSSDSNEDPHGNKKCGPGYGF